MKAINPSELWKKKLGDWVLNPYIGCEHGCFHCYCPAMPGVKMFNHGHAQEDWGKYIFPKPGFVDALKRQIKNFRPEDAKTTEWGSGWVLMSFLTDPYTPLEGKLKVTRECLKLLLEAGHKVRLQTRSAMVARDFDILRAHKDQVRLGTSLPYCDDTLARILEPRASGPSRRVKMLRQAAEAGIPVYIAMAPVFPFTPMHELDDIVEESFALNAAELFCEVLNPKGGNLKMVIDALDRGGRDGEAKQMREYDEARWAKQTFWTLFSLRKSKNFVPWPDTQRAWAKHLDAEQIDWLNPFLPPRER